MIWDVFGFWALGADTVIDLRIGVVRPPEGRLKAAGSMSGMMMDVVVGFGDVVNS
jgi:hypothetical protein